MVIWQQLTLILQWYAEPQSCDELVLHKELTESSDKHQT